MKKELLGLSVNHMDRLIHIESLVDLDKIEKLYQPVIVPWEYFVLEENENADVLHIEICQYLYL